MPTYVAFLRAINLGAVRKFPKEALAAATLAAGFDDVATHINTGNVRISTAMRSRARIEAALEKAYLADRDFEVPTIVLSQAELRDVAADAVAVREEFGADRVGVQYVSLLKDEPATDAVRALEERSTDDELVVVRGRGAHLLLAGDYHTAKLSNAAVEKHLGCATNRNVKVIDALVAKWC